MSPTPTVFEPNQPCSSRGHGAIDRRSLAFDELIRNKLLASPQLLEKAKANIARWKLKASAELIPTLDEWESILALPLAEIVFFLGSTTERATRLRQSSPFTGMLTNAERTAIIRGFSV